MTKTFTENSLLRFLYRDVSPQEKAEIEQSLLTRRCLSEKMKWFQYTLDQLDRVSYRASQSTVDKILFFSRNMNITDV